MRETPPGFLLWRSTLFTVGLIVLILIFATIGLCSAPLPYRLRYSIITLWNRCVLGWLRRICNLTHTIEGMEHIPEKPGVILCKHQSAWETIALGTIFGPQSWLLKRELLWIPFFGWGLALLKPIAIDRRAKRQAMTQLITVGKQRLQEGLWVVTFPEGTRMSPGTRGTYRKGPATLGSTHRVPYHSGGTQCSGFKEDAIGVSTLLVISQVRSRRSSLHAEIHSHGDFRRCFLRRSIA